MKTSIERLWNAGSLAAWSEAAHFAMLVMTTVSVFEAANYLRSLGAPLSIARLILLGV
jgi:hypothetical protein